MGDRVRVVYLSSVVVECAKISITISISMRLLIIVILFTNMTIKLDRIPIAILTVMYSKYVSNAII